MEPIKFLESGIKSNLKQRRALKQFLNHLFQKEQRRPKEIKIIFCTDEFLLSLNKKFLSHDFYTDTLTFLLSPSKQDILGEIYISIDRVKENSKKFKNLYQIELNRVIIHSCLHLCGYKDKPKKDEVEMLKKQELYLSELFHVKHSK